MLKQDGWAAYNTAGHREGLVSLSAAERETQRERQREREREREREGQPDGQRQRQKDRETEREVLIYNVLYSTPSLMMILTALASLRENKSVSSS